MTNFSWVQQHKLLISHAEAENRFARLGIIFQDAAPTGTRPLRPHTIGQPADQRFRIELIGPPEAVFKATMLYKVLPDSTLASVKADFENFLDVLLPSWTDRRTFLEKHLTAISQQPTAETMFHEFHIGLRANPQRTHYVLGLTWRP